MYGSIINQAKLAWNIGDLGVGLMAWFNIIPFFYKTGIVGFKGLRKQRKRGKILSLIQKILGVKCPYLEYNR
jgi:AGCS family alanine or glycine:cation symporter